MLNISRLTSIRSWQNESEKQLHARRRPPRPCDHVLAVGSHAHRHDLVAVTLKRPHLRAFGMGSQTRTVSPAELHQRISKEVRSEVREEEGVVNIDARGMREGERSA
eukprot:6184861-Pleurochrysis_carterae.AAC.2